MTDEEFERLKAAEKEHLRAKKKLQATLKQLRQKKQVRSAVERLARSAQSALDRASELIDRLTAETARDEARLDVALDNETVDATDDAVAAYEAERRDEEARALVRQMKHAQRIPSRSPDTARAPTDDSEAGATSSDDDLSTSSSDDLPDKTIGRMR